MRNKILAAKLFWFFFFFLTQCCKPNINKYKSCIKVISYRCIFYIKDIFFDQLLSVIFVVNGSSLFYVYEAL